MYLRWLVLVIVFFQDCSSQDEDGPYKGKFIGKLNSYHHQVSGDVYAIDEWTLLLVNFNYDGTGDDTFFWAGDSGRPGPQGFIVSDQHGKTNILERYYNEDVQLTLPEGKRISRIKWFAIYDIGSQNAFGDVYIPDDFDAPAEQSIGPLVGDTTVTSQSVRVVDASTLVIPEFRFDGSLPQVYFWTGVGPQPSARGAPVPDEDGYLEPLRAYSGEEVRLQLPGGRTVADIRWLSVWDLRSRRSLAVVLVPERLNVPPARAAPTTHRVSLPRCRQLHRDLQVAWEVFGNQITIQLAGKLQENEYMSFGISGNSSGPQMLHADVAVAYYDAKMQRGYATDYNITAYAPCVQVLDRWQGVCRDDALGGLDSNQVLSADRTDGVTRVTYRRELNPVESMDLPWSTEGPQQVVWAVGPLGPEGPAYHRLHPRTPVALKLTGAADDNDCFNFTVGSPAAPTPWETAQLFDPALRVFSFALGPAGGARGPAGRGRGRGRGGAPLAWYVNGQLAPDIQLRRGLLYTFKVNGGNDPHSATHYHPLVVTTDPSGGSRRGAILAGAHHPRRGGVVPTAAGPLCLASRAPGADGRRDASFATFRAFNRSLAWACGPEVRAAAASLRVAPNTSWPDLVYYNSFTHPGMGGRIFVVDRHRRSALRRAPSAGPKHHPSRSLAAAALAVLLALARPLH